MAIHRTAGFAGLLNRAAAYAYRRLIRPALPTGSHTEYNGVRIARARKIFDARLPQIFTPLGLEDIPEYEGTLASCLRRNVREGDRVVVVGGGLGVTAVIAAKQAGLSGSVLCYEGAERCVEDILEAARLNGVEGRVSVTHAVVARSIGVYGAESGHGAIVAPDAIPPCDILEMDCEGAEIDVLQQMKIRPRVILVETHGVFGAKTTEVEATLKDLFYDVTRVGVAEERLSAMCVRDDIYIVEALLQTTAVAMIDGCNSGRPSATVADGS